MYKPYVWNHVDKHVYMYIYIYIPVHPLPGVETNGLTNSIIPALLLFWWKAARFLATSCMQDILTYMYIEDICKYVQMFVYFHDK